MAYVYCTRDDEAKECPYRDKETNICRFYLGNVEDEEE